MVRHVDIGEYIQSLKLRLLIEPQAAVEAMHNIPGRKLIEVHREIDETHGSNGLPYRRTLVFRRSPAQPDHRLLRKRGHGRRAPEPEGTTRLFEIGQLKDRLKPDSTEHLLIIDALQAEGSEAATKLLPHISRA